MKKIIGIIPSTLGFNSDNPFDNKYYVQNSYVERIKLAGGIPIIIPPINLSINYEALQLCDAFLLIGGSDVWNYHFEVIDYVLKNHKKLLGICLGMQAIGMYSNNDLNEFSLKKVDNHYYDNITHDEKELLVHKVVLDPSSKLGKMLGSELMVNSIHNYALDYVSNPFEVVGYSDVIEAIEYKNVIGVQFHPELLDNAIKLFEWLVN